MALGERLNRIWQWTLAPVTPRIITIPDEVDVNSNLLGRVQQENNELQKILAVRTGVGLLGFTGAVIGAFVPEIAAHTNELYAVGLAAIVYFGYGIVDSIFAIEKLKKVQELRDEYNEQCSKSLHIQEIIEIRRGRVPIIKQISEGHWVSGTHPLTRGK